MFRSFRSGGRKEIKVWVVLVCLAALVLISILQNFPNLF